MSPKGRPTAIHADMNETSIIRGRKDKKPMEMVVPVVIRWSSRPAPSDSKVHWSAKCSMV